MRILDAIEYQHQWQRARSVQDVVERALAERSCRS
jgi:hypothetical protein